MHAKRLVNVTFIILTTEVRTISIKVSIIIVSLTKIKLGRFISLILPFASVKTFNNDVVALQITTT